MCALSHILQEGKLYIGNLAFKTTEEGLRESFGEHGEITFARVISDRDSGRSRYVHVCGVEVLGVGEGCVLLWCDC